MEATKDFFIRDSGTQRHLDRVSELAISLGKKLNRPEREFEALRYGGALHDIGKLGVPKVVLNKSGPFNDEERAIMKAHPDIGFKICNPLRQNLGKALEVVRHHHERLDGSGYPDGLKGSAVSMVSRIIAVADIYDALTSDRPYRKAMSKENALKILQKESREGKLDKDVVNCLTALVS